MSSQTRYHRTTRRHQVSVIRTDEALDKAFALLSWRDVVLRDEARDMESRLDTGGAMLS